MNDSGMINCYECRPEEENPKPFRSQGRSRLPPIFAGEVLSTSEMLEGPSPMDRDSEEYFDPNRPANLLFQGYIIERRVSNSLLNILQNHLCLAFEQWEGESKIVRIAWDDTYSQSWLLEPVNASTLNSLRLQWDFVSKGFVSPKDPADVRLCKLQFCRHLTLHLFHIKEDTLARCNAH